MTKSQKIKTLVAKQTEMNLVFREWIAQAYKMDNYELAERSNSARLYSKQVEDAIKDLRYRKVKDGFYEDSHFTLNRINSIIGTTKGDMADC